MRYKPERVICRLARLETPVQQHPQVGSRCTRELIRFTQYTLGYCDTRMLPKCIKLSLTGLKYQSGLYHSNVRNLTEAHS
jgi:hypothetical protein